MKLVLLIVLLYSISTVQAQTTYDIAIGRANPNGITLLEKGDIVRLGNNRYLLFRNIDFNTPSNPSFWKWGAKVVNYGVNDLTNQHRPRLYCRIDHQDALGFLTPSIYRDSIVLGSQDTLYAGDSTGILLHKETSPHAFLLSTNSPEGAYMVTYWVEQDSLDADTSNDTAHYTFNVSDNHRFLSGYFSKVGLAADGGPRAVGHYYPSGQHGGMEYGSVFYFPKGQSSKIQIDSIQWRYYLPVNYAGDTAMFAFAFVYKYDDTNSGAQTDRWISYNELTNIGLGVIPLTGLGTQQASGTYGLATVHQLLDAATGASQMCDLEDNSFYYISIQLTPFVLSGGVFDSTQVPHFGVDSINYALNTALTNTNFPAINSCLITYDTNQHQN